jgi:GT2 family glycosyltransferase
MPDISIILVNWNTRDLLLRSLQSICDTQGDLRVEVIVVDNASADDSVAQARARFPETIIVQNTRNAGFSEANNQGMAIASAPLLLLLNTDAFLHAGALQRMLAHMQAHPQAGALGCKLVYEDGSLQRSCNAFPTVASELWQALFLDRAFPNSRIFGQYTLSYWAMDDAREVDVVMGACMLLRREAIDQVGGFDTGFFMYSEEVDLCYRLKQAGWQVRYTPDAVATHIWGGSSRKVPRETFLRLYASRVRFFRKHYGRVATVLYKGVLFGSTLARAAGGHLYARLTRNERAQRGAGNYHSLLRALPGL